MDWNKKGEKFLRQGYGEAYEKGYEFLNPSKLLKALDCFEKVLEEDPKHPKALYNKVRALMGLFRFQEAEDFVKHAMTLLPKNSEMSPKLWALFGTVEGVPYRLRQWDRIKPEQLQVLKDLEHLLFTDFQTQSEDSKFYYCPAEYRHIYFNPYGFLVGSGVLFSPMKENNSMGVKVEKGNIVALGLEDYSGEGLMSLPTSFGQLASLQRLNLTGNPWVGEWQDIVKKDIPTILEFCRKHGK